MMIRNPVCASLSRLLSPSTCPLPSQAVRHAHQIGKQPLAWGHSHVCKWTNEKGKEQLRRIMPAVMKLSQERRGHLWNSKEGSQDGDTEATDGNGDLSKSNGPDGGGHKMAVVPSFARFAEFRERDLNFRAAKLHCVWRCAKMAGRPAYEKAIMMSLKLDTPIGVMTILKNTPEINYKLWLVKQMIRIVPLTLPDGIPDEDRFRGFLLKRNGQLVQSKLYRDNYNRARGRPDLERYVLLREEQECAMRKKWFYGSLDGTLLPTVSVDRQPASLMHYPKGRSQVGKGVYSTYRKTEGVM
ncbi:hypothetical protein BV898_03729 [Hypsibius exemplaris]|uniref:Uncharacterized protein n=1 Tax=Hypsibius exemplaris TaxID=2072580 RepID=A0A1W0X3U5_HYPEX|nr:hypothetical protein BV898_03729 [Hypsibius exemplaris]